MVRRIQLQEGVLLKSTKDEKTNYRGRKIISIFFGGETWSLGVEVKIFFE